jgi:hypothetical protein
VNACRPRPKPVSAFEEPTTVKSVPRLADQLVSAFAIRRGILGALISAFALSILVIAPSPAAAAPTASAWWHLTQRGIPSYVAPEGEGVVVDQAANLGDARTSGSLTITDQLPAGLEVQKAEFFSTAFIGGTEFDLNATFGFCEVKAATETSAASVSCTIPAERFEGEEPIFKTLIPFGYLEMKLTVKAQSGAVTAPNLIEAGGSSIAAARLRRPLPIAAGEAPFGAEELGLIPEDATGHIDTRAGSHPFQLTNTFTLNSANAEPFNPIAPVKSLHFNLPAGQIGNPRSLPKCTTLQFGAVGEGGSINQCADDTVIGVASVIATTSANTRETVFTVPLFNLTPVNGEPARFGFEFAGNPVILDTAVRSGDGEDYGITVSAQNITQVANLLSATTVFWGTPSDPRHDESRGWGCVAGGKWAAELVEQVIPCVPTHDPSHSPFLTLPTNCSVPYATSADGEAWPTGADPDGFDFTAFPYSLEDGVGNRLPLTACNQVPFAPKVEVALTSTAPASPTGLNFDLNFENIGLETEEGLAESEVKKTIVTLPAGVITNPAVASGLTACSRAQYESEGVEPGVAGCPESSKIGEVEIESPLVEPKIDGSIYVARQNENPYDNLLTIYMVARNPELGILVRSAGRVEPNQGDGQLTTTFDELPQLPFSHFHLHFREGQRAPLIAPGLCGTYASQADLYPYSDPDVAVHREASFTVAPPCASSESQLPNKPTLEAGTTSPIAGAYAPFVFKVSREDGSQTLSSITATLPEGLLGRLAGIPYCSDTAIAQAQSRSGEGQGALELASPSCPSASQVGTVNVGTGAGSQPYHVSGKAYLAGPYKGAPLSLEIITPAIAGPFDLGTVAVRSALYVNETTAQITARSDQIPTILHGLPLVLRSISLNMDRSSFTLNPTSCEPKQVTGSAISTTGDVAPLAERFQVGACGALAFKPELKLSYSGQTKRAGNPALKSVITYPKGDYANIARASVTLPKGVLISNAHINNPCTRVQFNSGVLPGEACPVKSVLGTAKVWTPLLEAPESGKIYFRSNGGERDLPDLVVALRGQIPTTLVGFIDSVGKKGAEVRRVRTRFQSVPDAPVSRFELKLYGGKRGLLESSHNLCKGSPAASVALTAQNGKTYDTEPKVSTTCGTGMRKNSQKH